MAGAPPKLPKAYCINCGYPLNTLTTPRCPECGRPFDARDPNSWVASKRGGWMWRFIKRPPSVVELVVTVATFLATLYAFCPPGYFERVWAACIWMWLLIASLLTLRVSSRLILKKDTAETSKAWQFWIATTVAPVLAIICIALVVQDVPLRTVTAIYKSRFEAIALIRPAPLGPVAPPTMQVGPYELQERYRAMGGYRTFSVAGDSGNNGNYFVFLPDEWLPYDLNNARETATAITKNWFIIKRRR